MGITGYSRTFTTYKGPTVNIFNSDGTQTDPIRQWNGGTGDLIMSNFGTWQASFNNLLFSASNGMSFQSIAANIDIAPAAGLVQLIAGTGVYSQATTGNVRWNALVGDYIFGDGAGANLPPLDNTELQVLTIDAATGLVSRRDVSSITPDTDTNLLNTNLTQTGGAKTHDFATSTQDWNDLGTWTVDGAGTRTITSIAGTVTAQLDIQTALGTVIQYDDSGSALNSTVSALFNGANLVHVDAGGDQALVRASGAGNVQLNSTLFQYVLGDGAGGNLPPIDVGEDTLLVLDPATGHIQRRDVSTLPFAAADSNFVNTNLTQGFNRTHTLANFTQIWNGAGTFQVDGIGNRTFITTAGTTSSRLSTASANSAFLHYINTATNAQTNVDANNAEGRVRFTNAAGQASGISFREGVVAGQPTAHLETAEIAAGTASVGDFLRLTSLTTGECEWAVAPGGGGNTIYSADDTLAGNRIVAGGTNTLTFNGLSAFDVVSTGAITLNSTSGVYELTTAPPTYSATDFKNEIIARDPGSLQLEKKIESELHDGIHEIEYLATTAQAPAPTTTFLICDVTAGPVRLAVDETLVPSGYKLRVKVYDPSATGNTVIQLGSAGATFYDTTTLATPVATAYANGVTITLIWDGLLTGQWYIT